MALTSVVLLVRAFDHFDIIGTSDACFAFKANIVFKINFILGSKRTNKHKRFVIKNSAEIMGNLFSYPLEAEATSYHRRQDYNSLGVRKTAIVKEENEIDKLHRKYCTDMFQHRKNDSAKRLFLTIEEEAYVAHHPQWDTDDIAELKLMFEIFDMNCDGLVDFRELAFVLDNVGENSRSDERVLCFEEIDLDKTGTIDFEEFLVVLSFLQKADSSTKTGRNIAQFVVRGANHIKQLRKISVYRQLCQGVF